jgi:hypothetical protein
MPDFTHYRIYLQAGLKEAERYLLSDDLFWPLSIAPTPGEPGYPNLTLGGLLLYQIFARPLAKSVSQKTTLRKINIEIEATRTRWQVAWERKASWEFKSRLRQWGNFLKEVRVDPEDNIGYYHYEVRFRVMLDLLKPEIREVTPAVLEQLNGLDVLLRALFAPGDFIWEPELETEFPKERFWYLWGVLKEP